MAPMIVATPAARLTVAPLVTSMSRAWPAGASPPAITSVSSSSAVPAIPPDGTTGGDVVSVAGDAVAVEGDAVAVEGDAVAGAGDAVADTGSPVAGAGTPVLVGTGPVCRTDMHPLISFIHVNVDPRTS